jgi:hypothetical protein
MNNTATFRSYIGLRIFRRRQKMGLPLPFAAYILAVPVDELKAYECGTKEIYPEMLLKLSKLLRTSISYYTEGLN